MIDRLPILALKIYHTREERSGAVAPEGHAERNWSGAILEEQRRDLAVAWTHCGAKTLEGTRRFKALSATGRCTSDPALNPAIYRTSSPAKLPADKAAVSGCLTGGGVCV